MESIFVKILFILFIGVIVYILFNVFNKDYTLTHQKCQMENFDIDDLIVIKRTPEYSNLIDKMVEDKSFIFNDQQLKVLKNPQQIFEVKSNNKNDNNIKNISDIIKDKDMCHIFFPQNTNVFAYYILKNILLMNHIDYGNILIENTDSYKIRDNIGISKIINLINTKIYLFKILDLSKSNSKNNSLRLCLYEM